MLDRSAASMEAAIRKVAGVLPKKAIQTATTNRGKEFSWYENIEMNLRIQVNFADPYSFWQKGSNENNNGRLCEFYPKGTNFVKLEPAELAHPLRLINNRQRKGLGLKTP